MQLLRSKTIQQKIKRFYLIQLLSGFLYVLLVINSNSLLTGYDSYATSRIFILSIVASLIFTIFNVVINALNFSYLKYKDSFTAFCLPLIFWLVFFIASLIGGEDYLLLIILVEPILYNTGLVLIMSHSNEIVQD